MLCSGLSARSVSARTPHEGAGVWTEVPRLVPRRSIPSSGKNSRSEGVGKVRALLGLVSLLTGIYVYSSSAVAEVEEDTDQGENKSSFVSATLSHALTIDFLINNYDNITIEDVAKYLLILNDPSSAAGSVHPESGTFPGSHYKFVYPAGSNEADSPLIPTAVWSLDTSTGVHLDHMSPGLGSETYTVFAGRRQSPFFWSKGHPGLWTDNPDGGDPQLLITPQNFQVANCGGNSAEHSNLDYCINKKDKSNQQDDKSNQNQLNTKSSQIQSTNIDDTLSAASTSIISSNGSNISSVSFSIPDDLISQEGITFIVPCDSVSEPCVISKMDQPTTVINPPTPNSPTPLSDDPNSPIVPSPLEVLPPEVLAPSPVVSVDDPGLPAFTPPPPVASVPEAPTWVMTILGFSVVAFIYRNRRYRSFNRLSMKNRSRDTEVNT